MPNNRWLTPDDIPAETFCRVLHIPKNVYIQAAITGALLELTFPTKWEQVGTITPDEIAASMLDMLNDFSEQSGGCMPLLGQPTFVEDRKTQNTAGGASVANTWTTRTLNTILGSIDNGITLSSDRFTVPAGRWLIKASAPAYASGRHKIALADYPTAAHFAHGTSEQNGASADAQTRSFCQYTALLNNPVTFQILHNVSGSKATNGFGVPTNLSTEVYTQVEIYPLS